MRFCVAVPGYRSCACYDEIAAFGSAASTQINMWRANPDRRPRGIAPPFRRGPHTRWCDARGFAVGFPANTCGVPPLSAEVLGGRQSPHVGQGLRSGGS